MNKKYDEVEFGDIVNTHFIDRTLAYEEIYKPYIELDKKHRPCLVIGKFEFDYVDELTDTECTMQALKVIYGTSQEVRQPGQIDEILLITEEEIKESKLSVKTKWIFSPSNYAVLPFDACFFDLWNLKRGHMTRKKVKNIHLLRTKPEFVKLMNDVELAQTPMLSCVLWDVSAYNINKSRLNHKYRK